MMISQQAAPLGDRIDPGELLMETTKDAVFRALRTVNYPGFTRDIVSFRLVHGVLRWKGQLPASAWSRLISPGNTAGDG